MIVLEFEPTPNELAEFREEIKSRLSGTIPLRLTFGPRDVSVTVSKQGRGNTTLSRKSPQIASFVARRLDFEHIPAVHTAQSAQEIVSDLVDRELREVESNDEYTEALKRIEDLQQPILDHLSESIQNTLVQFLPKVVSVNVQIPQDRRYRALRRNCEIVIDDGSPTALEYKGDGVQSLAAIAIMRHASEHASGTRNTVIAIEEPESHLHPEAIHEIRYVISELSNKYQIVLTTHNPLFVDRLHIHRNIVVNQSHARPAKSIEEVRRILGVRASDNLRHANLVLIVEGEEDRVSLRALLAHHSAAIRMAFDKNVLVIDSLGGASNLAYKLGLIRDSLCLHHTFLDDDEAGRKGFERAMNLGLTSDSETNFAVCRGKSEAEFEDLLAVEIYRESLQSKFGISLAVPSFRKNRKWGDRIRETFRSQGKQWNDRIAGEVKSLIASNVASSPGNSLGPQGTSAFDALVASLESKLGEIEKSQQ